MVPPQNRKEKLAMMPREIARAIVQMTDEEPVPQDRIDSLAEDLIDRVGYQEAKRLLLKATAPTIH